MRESTDKVVWGHVEKIGKGTRANYEPDKKTITFCFKRDEHTSAEQLRKLRENLMNELRQLGYSSKMKYNGEVIAENIEEQEVVVERKNHQLTIKLNKKGSGKEEKDASEQPT
jgi:acetylornithine deacetylase/succinyl-diaminopimelate desuccinylase-like protein